MPDPTTPTPIDAAGLRRLRYPIRVKDRAGQLQSTVAALDITLTAPADDISLPRIVEVLNAHRGELTITVLPDLLAELQRRLGAAEARIRVDFPYFIDQPAPTGGRALRAYRCGFHATRSAGAFDFRLEVGAPVARGAVDVVVESAGFVWIEDVVAAIEACPPGPVDALAAAVLTALCALPAVRAVDVTAERRDAHDDHAVFARARWRADAAEPPPDAQPDPAPIPPPEPFGAWLRARREARALSQHELAERWGYSTSFVSRVESGAKTPGPDALTALAAVLGHDPDKLHLRAGVVPPALLDRIRAAPESFLRWAGRR